MAHEDNFSTTEKEVRDRLGEDFDKCYKYIEEGNDLFDLIITVLDYYTMTKEGAEQFIKEVHEMMNNYEQED